jgi:hypothetical protein
LFERPWIVTLTRFSVAETGERGEGKPSSFKMPSPIPYSYRRAVLRWQQASRSFVVFPKRDARELSMIPLIRGTSTDLGCLSGVQQGSLVGEGGCSRGLSAPIESGDYDPPWRE